MSSDKPQEPTVIVNNSGDASHALHKTVYQHSLTGGYVGGSAQNGQTWGKIDDNIPPGFPPAQQLNPWNNPNGHYDSNYSRGDNFGSSRRTGERSYSREIYYPGAEWRPVGALEEREKLTFADRSMLTKLETAFMSGDFKSLSDLVARVNPTIDGNTTDRECFSHAFKVFQLEMGAIGFDARYDSKTGVFFIKNEQPVTDSACIQKLLIDPTGKHLWASRKDDRNKTNDDLYINTETGAGTEHSLRFNPRFSDTRPAIDAEQVDSKYGDVLKDQINRRLEAIEHHKLDESRAQWEEQNRKALENYKRQQEEMNRAQEEIRLQIIMEEQRRGMQGGARPATPNF